MLLNQPPETITKVKVFNWNSGAGTKPAFKMWANLKLVLLERELSNWKGKLQNSEQDDPEAFLMIIVGRKGMHTGVIHMRTRPQPNELQKTHLFTQSRCKAG